MSHEVFFEKYGSNDLQHVGYHGGPILVEALYQAFKARLIAELRVTTPELLERAELLDTSDEQDWMGP